MTLPQTLSGSCRVVKSSRWRPWRSQSLSMSITFTLYGEALMTTQAL